MLLLSEWVGATYCVYGADLRSLRATVWLVAGTGRVARSALVVNGRALVWVIGSVLLFRSGSPFAKILFAGPVVWCTAKRRAPCIAKPAGSVRY